MYGQCHDEPLLLCIMCTRENGHNQRKQMKSTGSFLFVSTNVELRFKLHHVLILYVCQYHPPTQYISWSLHNYHHFLCYCTLHIQCILHILVQLCGTLDHRLLWDNHTNTLGSQRSCFAVKMIAFWNISHNMFAGMGICIVTSKYICALFHKYFSLWYTLFNTVRACTFAEIFKCTNTRIYDQLSILSPNLGALEIASCAPCSHTPFSYWSNRKVRTYRLFTLKRFFSPSSREAKNIVLISDSTRKYMLTTYLQKGIFELTSLNNWLWCFHCGENWHAYLKTKIWFSNTVRQSSV